MRVRKLEVIFYMQSTS